MTVLKKAHMLHCAASLRHCGVHKVRLIPQDLRALPMNFLRNRLIGDFLRGRQ
jgi:hypothetical protein